MPHWSMVDVERAASGERRATMFPADAPRGNRVDRHNNRLLKIYSNYRQHIATSAVNHHDGLKSATRARAAATTAPVTTAMQPHQKKS
ncbi:hypothetical protein ACI65C_000188 [Semiaphis heraclei]